MKDKKLEFKIMTVINALLKENEKLKSENENLKGKLEDLKNSSTEEKKVEYDELIDELKEQKKEYAELIHDAKKLKRTLEMELVRMDEG